MNLDSLTESYNLGQKKMEQQTPIPPPPQIKDDAARRAKTRHFPILDLGGRGGLGFPFILSKIVGSYSVVQAVMNITEIAPKNSIYSTTPIKRLVGGYSCSRSTKKELFDSFLTMAM